MEDVGDGLVLWSDLGRAAGVGTPTIDSIIHLASLMLEENFYGDGLTLEKLGIDADKDLNTQV